MAINKVQYGNTTLIDLTDTTAVASDVAQGKYFYGRDGVRTEGTSTGGGGTGGVTQDQDGYLVLDDQPGGGSVTVEALSVTQNGTYTAPTGKAYSPVTVNVSGGGGVTPAPQKQINFIDYDGTILYSYTKAEITAMSSESDLPANPSHTGLTAQGWNWTLAQIKAQLTAVPDGDVWVGQMYITQSGDTEIDVSMPEGRLDPILTIAVNGTVTVDWGDNTSADTVTGSSLTTRQAVSHTYASAGDYTIIIHSVSGDFTFYGSSTYTLLRKNATGNENRVYANCVQNIRLGSGITSIATGAFYYCYSLASITIPNTITNIAGSTFYYCCSLSSITIPNTVTSIGGSTFYNCVSLSSVAIPIGITYLGASAFYYCYALSSVTIPSGVPEIGSYTFGYCCSLASITIPSGVTNIVTGAFNSCYGMSEYHVKPTTPPTLDSSVFGGIVSDCKIYVPSASLSDYQTDTNWSAYASYMVGE